MRTRQRLRKQVVPWFHANIATIETRVEVLLDVK